MSEKKRLKLRLLKNQKKCRKSQVWIETATYFLIGIAIMGALIAIVSPKVKQMVHEMAISGSIESLNKINEEIKDCLIATGNQREIILSVKRGEYTIDSLNNKIYFILKETNLLYSQPGEIIKEGDIQIITTEKSKKRYSISLILDYSSFNMTYQNQEINKTFSSASTPYRFLIINKDGADKQVDIQSI